MHIWDISSPFVKFCVYLVPFSGFGIMYQEKSGNLVTEIGFLRAPKTDRNFFERVRFQA
jgi:hypothetical protein